MEFWKLGHGSEVTLPFLLTRKLSASSCLKSPSHSQAATDPGCLAWGVAGEPGGMKGCDLQEE